MGNILVCGEIRPDHCRFLCNHCLRFYKDNKILVAEKDDKTNQKEVKKDGKI